MKKAVMFDLDGTLINSLPDIAAAMNRALAAHSLPTHSLDAYLYMVGDGVINLAKRAVKDRQDKMEDVLHAYRQDYALNCSVKTCPYDGIPSVLRQLKEMGMKIFVFSNKDQSDAETVCAHYFPSFSFDVIRGRVENVPVKPAPDGAFAILNSQQILPGDCWYVGDTDTDMRCGTAAQMDTIGVLWGFREKEELIRCGAKHLAQTPSDLLKIMQAK